MLNNELLRLVYFSTVKSTMTNDDLDKILTQSRINNSAMGITGILFYGGTDFIQVLEGEQTHIINLYAKIINDTRHWNCRILDIHFDKARIFRDWSMGYVNSSKADFERLSSLLEHRYKQHLMATKEITDILRSYLGKVAP